VGFALIGSISADDPGRTGDRVLVPTPTIAVSSPAAPAEYRMSLTAPPARNVAIRTRTVDVAGMVVGGGRIVVTLESRGAHLLESRSVIAGADGRFRASFPLPQPRPGGLMWVSAVLVADDGLPIEAIRRSIISGPLDEPTLGDDGLIGGNGHPIGG
jgi:hypothetical protein